MSAHVLLYPQQTVFVCVCGGGGGVLYCFHVVGPSVRDVLVFQYLEKAMMEFHQIW